MKKLAMTSFDILGLIFRTFRRGTPTRAQIGWLVSVRSLPRLREPERKNLTFFPRGFERNIFRRGGPKKKGGRKMEGGRALVPLPSPGVSRSAAGGPF